MEDKKTLAFRQDIDDEMKEIRFVIGNVSCDTTHSQRDNLIKRIHGLQDRLKGSIRSQRNRIRKNEERLAGRISVEAREKFKDRVSSFNDLIKIAETHLVKTRYLIISAKNQFEKFPEEK